jgi:hypothetical protein
MKRTSTVLVRHDHEAPGTATARPASRPSESPVRVALNHLKPGRPTLGLRCGPAPAIRPACITPRPRPRSALRAREEAGWAERGRGGRRNESRGGTSPSSSPPPPPPLLFSSCSPPLPPTSALDAHACVRMVGCAEYSVPATEFRVGELPRFHACEWSVRLFACFRTRAPLRLLPHTCACLRAPACVCSCAVLLCVRACLPVSVLACVCACVPVCGGARVLICVCARACAAHACGSESAEGLSEREAEVDHAPHLKRCQTAAVGYGSA